MYIHIIIIYFFVIDDLGAVQWISGIKMFENLHIR